MGSWDVIHRNQLSGCTSRTQFFRAHFQCVLSHTLWIREFLKDHERDRCRNGSFWQGIFEGHGICNAWTGFQAIVDLGSQDFHATDIYDIADPAMNNQFTALSPASEVSWIKPSVPKSVIGRFRIFDIAFCQKRIANTHVANLSGAERVSLIVNHVNFAVQRFTTRRHRSIGQKILDVLEAPVRLRGCVKIHYDVKIIKEFSVQLVAGFGSRYVNQWEPVTQLPQICHAIELCSRTVNMRDTCCPPNFWIAAIDNRATVDKASKCADHEGESCSCKKDS